MTKRKKPTLTERVSKLEEDMSSVKGDTSAILNLLQNQANPIPQEEEEFESPIRDKNFKPKKNRPNKFIEEYGTYIKEHEQFVQNCDYYNKVKEQTVKKTHRPKAKTVEVKCTACGKTQTISKSLKTSPHSYRCNRCCAG